MSETLKKGTERQNKVLTNTNWDIQSQMTGVKRCDRTTGRSISCTGCKSCPADTEQHVGQHGKHTINSLVPVYCHSGHTLFTDRGSL